MTQFASMEIYGTQETAENLFTFPYEFEKNIIWISKRTIKLMYYQRIVNVSSMKAPLMWPDFENQNRFLSGVERIGKL